VFLSEVLWDERVGLLPEDDRWYTVYLAQHPIGLFDSQQLRVAPVLSNSPVPSPNRTRKYQICARSKVSGMPPAIHIGRPVLAQAKCLSSHGRHFHVAIKG
jgi:hypothetical protein